jgi:hypothetical protein
MAPGALVPVLLLLFAAPFWEAKTPEQWTALDLQYMLSESPWAQVMAYRTTFHEGVGVRVYLATARPVRDAESELQRRKPSAETEDAAELREEYEEFLRLNEGKIIVLAIAYPNALALSEAPDAARMETDCLLKIGRKTYPLEGHFPPTPSDPYLRLVFPRAVAAKDKRFSFELYLPGIHQPFREAEFYMKDLIFKGSPEF